MGIFSSIGSIVGGAFFGPTGAKVGAGLGGVLDAKKSHKEQRYSGGETQTKTQESRINFQQMADDARAAGFNPLTALRTTGGMGNVTTRYSTPLIDHGKFGIGDALAGAYSGYSNYKAMAQQKTQFGLETDLIKSQIALNTSNAMPKVVEDIWGKYNDTDKKVPVNYLGTDFELPKSMAEFMRIKPNQSLGAGQMTEITGEGSEIFNFFSSSGQQRTFGIDITGRRPNDGGSTLLNFLIKDKTPKLRPFTVSSNVVQFNANEVIQVSKIPVLTDNFADPFMNKISNIFNMPMPQLVK